MPGDAELFLYRVRMAVIRFLRRVVGCALIGFGFGAVVGAVVCGGLGALIGAGVGFALVIVPPSEDLA
ncbi:hypothetical protein [Microbacterium sp. VKM Ac-2870]|uniref:hypothetical protein n=1 Tax=Microbacterium sp. VKM Ac-2870 TaxID=2783825 RepID=UPI00188AA1EE|nr:hypothetical protein [Microbacterium sp. VKM Ac-2870]